TSDPTGIWYPYFFPSYLDGSSCPDGVYGGGYPLSDGSCGWVFPDFPGLGVGSDLVVLTGAPLSGTKRAQTYTDVFWVVNKSDLLSGQAARGSFYACGFGSCNTAYQVPLQPNSIGLGGPFGEVSIWGIIRGSSHLDILRLRATGVPPSPV